MNSASICRFAAFRVQELGVYLQIYSVSRAGTRRVNLQRFDGGISIVFDRGRVRVRMNISEGVSESVGVNNNSEAGNE